MCREGWGRPCARARLSRGRWGLDRVRLRVAWEFSQDEDWEQSGKGVCSAGKKFATGMGGVGHLWRRLRLRTGARVGHGAHTCYLQQLPACAYSTLYSFFSGIKHSTQGCACWFNECAQWGARVDGDRGSLKPVLWRSRLQCFTPT